MPRPTANQPGLSAEQIKVAARSLMEEHGTAGLTLRGVARLLGVTAPAIYNYFPRMEDLITALIVDAFTDLAENMEKARSDANEQTIAEQITAMVMAYRNWAIRHPIDFLLIFGNPIPGYQAPEDITTPLARRPFLGLFELYTEALEKGELVIPEPYQQIPTNILKHIAGWIPGSTHRMPGGLVLLLMSGWSRIHGLVSLELLHHTGPVIGDTAALYEVEIKAILTQLGMQAGQE